MQKKQKADDSEKDGHEPFSVMIMIGEHRDDSRPDHAAQNHQTAYIARINIRNALKGRQRNKYKKQTRREDKWKRRKDRREKVGTEGER